MNRQTFLALHPSIATERVVLRPFLADDVYDFYAYAADPVFQRVGGLRPMRGFQQAQIEVATFYNLQRMGRMLPLAILEQNVKHHETAMIGHVFLQFIDWRERQAEILFGVHPERWGCGLATEAVRAVVGYAFGELELRSLTAACHADNQRSRRVLARVGFELVSAGVNGIDLYRLGAVVPQTVGHSA